MNDSEVGARPALLWPAAWKAIAGLGILVFLIFADMLLAPGRFVLGNETADMFLQFFSWRQFGFGQLSQGNLALWNPHIYGGAPYFGGTQGAMLYPTNLLLLFLPLPLAINWSIALNVWLLGVFMYVWAGFRGYRPLACFAGGVILMFCGPHFLHVYSGHPVHMASMTWVPLILLAIDGVFASVGGKPASVGGKPVSVGGKSASGADKLVSVGGKSASGGAKAVAKWCWLGMFAVAMQVFAGHPQYLFYTGISAGIYALLGGIQVLRALPRQGRELVVDKKGLVRAFVIPMAALGAIFGGGSALSAVQLLTAIQSNGETIRSVRVPFQFAAMFGFPPENLLTFLNPYIFGDMNTVAYWGRCYLWEMSIFIGVTALALAIYGIIYGREKVVAPKSGAGKSSKKKESAPSLIPLAPTFPSTGILIALALVTFIFALGVHTPLFQFLYNYVPGFGKFRGISKFTFQTVVFLGMLSVVGFDRILGKAKIERGFVMGVALIGGLLALWSASLFLQSPADFQGWLRAIQSTQESYLPAPIFGDPGFANQARLFAAKALLFPALLLLAAAGLLHLKERWKQAMNLLTLILVVETFFFALHTRATFDSQKVISPGVKEVTDKNPGDYRILNLLSPNSALSTGAQDLWGHDPGVARRYAELMAWSQGVSPDEATQYVPFKNLDPLYTMFRFRYAFAPAEQGMRVFDAPVPPMDRVTLVSDCQVLRRRDDIFNAMRAADFNPRNKVILEQAPAPWPEPASGKEVGKVRVVASSTDWLEVEADLTAPAILLNTDVYTPGWRAVALPGSSQSQYNLQPGNYALRAIPLGAGHHRIRIEYAPAAFYAGKWISIVSWLGFIGLLCAQKLGRSSHPAQP